MADVVFHTSGSTGAAKCIVRSEASLQEDARRLVAAFPDVWVSRPYVVATVRPEHMYGALWRVRAPTVAGCTVEEVIVFSVEELLSVARTRGNGLLLVTTPSFLEKALGHPDFPRLRGAFRAIVTSGSLLRGETARTVEAAVGTCPLEIYGSTETGTVAWRRRSEGEHWTPVAGVRCRLSPDGRLEVDSPFAMERPFVMGDVVEFVGDGRFILKGRADRRVKILEEYVSISEVEAALESHPFVDRARVEPYGEGVVRLGALVTLTDAGRAAAVRDGQGGESRGGAVATSLRAFLRERLDSLAIPRRYRVVRELPVNEQGKTTAEAVRSALGAWCREPLVNRWQATAGALEAELVFTGDMECFRGHFPGYPVLPGVAQLYFLRHFARQVFPDWPDAATYRRLKFQKLVRPNESVTLKVERRADDTFAFSLSLESGPCATGVVERSAS